MADVQLAGNLARDAGNRYFFGPSDGTQGKIWKGIQITGDQYAGGVVLYGPDGITPLILDDAAFVPATRYVLPIGAFADETSPDSVDEGDVGIPRMTLKRLLKVEASQGLPQLLVESIGAAGAGDVTLTPTAGTIWQITVIDVTVVADANVGNRELTTNFRNVAAYMFSLNSDLLQTAGQTRIYTYLSGGGFKDAAFGSNTGQQMLPLPTPLHLTDQIPIRFILNGVQAGDTMAIRIMGTVRNQ